MALVIDTTVEKIREGKEKIKSNDGRLKVIWSFSAGTVF